MCKPQGIVLTALSAVVKILKSATNSKKKDIQRQLQNSKKALIKCEFLITLY